MASSFRRFFRGSSSRQAVPYPDPYVDIASFNIPPSIKSIGILARRLFLTNSLVNRSIRFLANYPITDIKTDAPTENIKSDWERLTGKHLALKAFDQQMMLDKLVYGNMMASVVLPFDKYLICSSCNYEQLASDPDTKYKFNVTGSWDYRGKCPACQKTQVFLVEDRHVPAAWRRVSLLRWPPLSIDIDYNPYFGEYEYYHRIPRVIRDKLAVGNRLLTSRLPKGFILAAKLGKRIRLNQENFFHDRLTSISDIRMSFSPWGVSALLPVAKDVFWLQILKKTDEAYAFNHILPLRFLFPQTAAASASPMATNLGFMRGRLEGEVRKWIRDPNYIGISPVPLGQTTLGEGMRPMLLGNEVKIASDFVMAGLGLPKGILFGDMQYAAGNLIIRMLENDFIDTRAAINSFNNDFVKGRLRDYLDWPDCDMRLANLRTADDIQLKQFWANANAQGKISDDTYFSDALGLDSATERKKRRSELMEELEMQKMQAVAAAESQGLAGLVTARYTAEAQKLQMALAGGMPGAPGAGGFPTGEPTDAEAAQSAQPPQMSDQIDAHAVELAQMPEDQRNATLDQMRTSGMPTYAQTLQQRMQQKLQEMNAAGAGGATPEQPGAVDMRPMPDKLPPRRPNPGI